jgi:myo-inositol-1(or 4)-monophosphatase
MLDKKILEKQVLEQFKEFLLLSEKSGSIESRLKGPNDPVTELDVKVSKIFETAVDGLGAKLLSEENSFRRLSFPLHTLDPIDGTRELVKGWPECCLSYAYLESSAVNDPKSYAWLWNPFTGFSLDSKAKWINAPSFRKNSLLALVSESEFSEGIFDQFLDAKNIFISPRGSIAFKLGLLSSGACDFVVSLRPKNIWDIAAGTLLCAQRGIKFYVDGNEVTNLSSLVYSGKTLLWTRPELKSEGLELFQY